jgi:OTU domain-containing protein 6
MGKKKSSNSGSGGGGGGGDDRPSPEDAVKGETLEQLEKRHTEEVDAVKEVTGKLGKGKGDKDKALRMEGEVSDRHYAETAAWEELDEARNPPVPKATGDDDEDEERKQISAPSLAPPVLEMAKASVADDGGEGNGFGGGAGGVMTKAMKRRLKKEGEEAERDARIQEEKANMGPSNRENEEKALKLLLTPLRLKIKDIKADGHCMYRSVEDQLAQKPHTGGGDVGGSSSGGDSSYASLRRRCAAVMRKNRWDYRPFLPDCAEAGLYRLNPVDRQLESARFPPLNLLKLYPGFEPWYSNSTCNATPRIPASATPRGRSTALRWRTARRGEGRWSWARW